MFSHYQRHGKCEWRGGGLDKFVSHYNRENGTNYAHTECLDIVRTGGRTEPKPEVLLTDARCFKQMVVERKSVVWPPSYILRHQNEHDFANVIWQQTKDGFQDDCYELTVSAEELGKLDSHTVKQIGLEIGSVLAGVNPSSIPLRSSTPVPWHFHRANTYDDYGTRKGIVVIHQGPIMTTFEDFNRDEAIVGTAAAMERELAEAATKFIGYEAARKVVLLDFYGNELGEEDIPPLLVRIALPKTIDEIWMTKCNWVSEDDFEIGFERLFVSSTWVNG
jgi:hypothetical protein